MANEQEDEITNESSTIQTNPESSENKTDKNKENLLLCEWKNLNTSSFWILLVFFIIILLVICFWLAFSLAWTNETSETIDALLFFTVIISAFVLLGFCNTLFRIIAPNQLPTLTDSE